MVLKAHYETNGSNFCYYMNLPQEHDIFEHEEVNDQKKV